MTVTNSAATTPTAGIGEFNAQRPAATKGRGIEPSAPWAAALQPAGLQVVAPGCARAGPPLFEPEDVTTPAAPDEAAPDLGAETDVAPPVEVVVVGALVGGGAELEDGFGEGDGDGALTVYGAVACVPATVAPFWTRAAQIEYCAGGVPAGAWSPLTVRAPQRDG